MEKINPHSCFPQCKNAHSYVTKKVLLDQYRASVVDKMKIEPAMFLFMKKYHIIHKRKLQIYLYFLIIITIMIMIMITMMIMITIMIMTMTMIMIIMVLAQALNSPSKSINPLKSP